LKLVERAHLHLAADSHPGMSGKNNEDRYAISAYEIEGSPPVQSVLAIVSDGIGGHRAGEVAAEIAVETISQVVAASDGRQPNHTLDEAISQASEKIFQQAEKQSDQKGMGATCACCWVIGDRLYTANVGDSRIYLLHNGDIRQISTDHTWIQEALDHGALSPDQARGHPNAHVIRRYLGSRQPVEADHRLRLNPHETDSQSQANQGLQLLPGDLLLLCSDGLTDLVEPDEILGIIKNHAQDQAIRVLINLANQRGGHDNITIVTMQVPETLPQGKPVPVSMRSRLLQPACLGIGVLAILAVAGLIGLFVLLNLPKPVILDSPSPTLTWTVRPATQRPSMPPTMINQPTATEILLPTETLLPVSSSTLPPSPTALIATLTPWPTNTTIP
jgi:serine/threonine protein phosphatase PrpC